MEGRFLYPKNGFSKKELFITPNSKFDLFMSLLPNSRFRVYPAIVDNSNKNPLHNFTLSTFFSYPCLFLHCHRMLGSSYIAKDQNTRYISDISWCVRSISSIEIEAGKALFSCVLNSADVDVG